MIAIQNDILHTMTSIQSGLLSFLDNMDWIISVGAGIYILIIAGIVRSLRNSSKTLQHIRMIFQVAMDELYYQTSLRLYQHKNDIYNASETIPLLLEYKSKAVAQGDEKSYLDYYSKLIDEIEYIGQLTNDPITYDRTKLDDHYYAAQKIYATHQTLKNTLGILTLGISNLF